MPHAVDDSGQLLEGAPDLGPLAGHGFQQHAGALAGNQDLVQALADELNALVDALLDVTAGVEVVVVARKGLHAFEVLGHGAPGEFDGLGLGRAQVHGVGRMGH